MFDVIQPDELPKYAFDCSKKNMQKEASHFLRVAQWARKTCTC